MVQKFMVKKSGVEKFIVEKSGVEMSGVEAWGWDVLQPSLILNFHFSDRAAIGVEISGKSSFTIEYNCESSLHPKGQLISEWLFDFLNFPKKPMQTVDEFLP